MSADEQAILDRVNADNWAILYRCRWSEADARREVPKLAHLLESDDSQIANEALRALFRIGTLAEQATPGVVKLIRSADRITKRLAILTLGQIAHKAPVLCVEPLATALTDTLCCRDAMRALAYIGPEAISALDRVLQLFSNRDAKIRKDVVVTAALLDAKHPTVVELLRNASFDRNKIVRNAASAYLRRTQAG